MFQIKWYRPGQGFIVSDYDDRDIAIRTLYSLRNGTKRLGYVDDILTLDEVA